MPKRFAIQNPALSAEADLHCGHDGRLRFGFNPLSD
jgi:hypothetical protein